MNNILIQKDSHYIDHHNDHIDFEQVAAMINKLAVCLTDHKGNFMEINDNYLALYGYHEEELIGNHFTMVLPKEFREYGAKLHDDFIAGSVEMPAEWQVKNKQGDLIKIRAIAVRVQSTEDDKPPTKMTLIERI
jgi:PAS domain S-box-containing protein